MSLLGKAAAGVMAGFVLSACLLALTLRALPGHGQAWLVAALIIFVPLWLALVAASFLFRSVRRAWLLLGLPALLSWGVLQWLNHAMPA